MSEVNPEIKDTLDKINNNWGGSFEIEFIENWKSILKKKKEDGKLQNCYILQCMDKPLMMHSRQRFRRKN